MEDQSILDLYFQRSEQAIVETDRKYGGYCYSVAYNILSNREDSEESVSDAYLQACLTKLILSRCQLNGSIWSNGRKQLVYRGYFRQSRLRSADGKQEQTGCCQQRCGFKNRYFHSFHLFSLLLSLPSTFKT